VTSRPGEGEEGREREKERERERGAGDKRGGGKKSGPAVVEKAVFTAGDFRESFASRGSRARSPASVPVIADLRERHQRIAAMTVDEGDSSSLLSSRERRSWDRDGRDLSCSRDSRKKGNSTCCPKENARLIGGNVRAR